MSAWNLHLEGARQANLIVTKPHQPKITVDNLEMAEFIYLVLHNEQIRHVIDTITSKVVLILGRFTRRESRPGRPSRGSTQARLPAREMARTHTSRSLGQPLAALFGAANVSSSDENTS